MVTFCCCYNLQLVGVHGLTELIGRDKRYWSDKIKMSLFARQ
jgi:hypothetical protein